MKRALSKKAGYEKSPIKKGMICKEQYQKRQDMKRAI